MYSWWRRWGPMERLAIAAAFAVAASGSPAAEPAANTGPRTVAATVATLEAQTHEYVTKHKGRFYGRDVAYTAKVGEILLKDETGRPTASVFAISYIESGADPARRPVTFIYNGGPGASTAFLRVAAFGPYRVVFPRTGPNRPEHPLRP